MKKFLITALLCMIGVSLFAGPVLVAPGYEPPDQTGQSGKFLQTTANGTVWANPVVSGLTVNVNEIPAYAIITANVPQVVPGAAPSTANVLLIIPGAAIGTANADIRYVEQSGVTAAVQTIGDVRYAQTAGIGTANADIRYVEQSGVTAAVQTIGDDRYVQPAEVTGYAISTTNASALYQPLDATLTDLAAAPLVEANSVSLNALVTDGSTDQVIGMLADGSASWIDQSGGGGGGGLSTANALALFVSINQQAEITWSAVTVNAQAFAGDGSLLTGVVGGAGISTTNGDLRWVNQSTVTEQVQTIANGQSIATANVGEVVPGYAIGTANAQALFVEPAEVTGYAISTTNASALYLDEASNLSDLPNAGTARINLGVAIGSDVQAWNTHLDDLADGSLTATKIADGSVSNEEYQRLDGVTQDLTTVFNQKMSITDIGGYALSTTNAGALYQPLDATLTDLAAAPLVENNSVSLNALVTDGSTGQAVVMLADGSASWATVAGSVDNTFVTNNYKAGTVSINNNVEITGTLKIGAFTLPNTDGTSNQILKTNGSGAVTWQDDATGGGGGGGATTIDVTFKINGSWAATSINNVLETHGLMKGGKYWSAGPATLVGAAARVYSQDTGANEPELVVNINGLEALTLLNVTDGSWVTDTCAANCTISDAQSIELGTNAGGSNNDSKELNVTLWFTPN